MSLIDYDSRFKFRIWHKEFKRFLTGEEWYLDLNGQVYFFNQPFSESAKEFIKCKEPYVLQQCTGATDKNKKLIYEGDIVKVKRSFVRPFINDNIEIDYKFEEGEEETGHILWFWCSYKYLVSYEHIRHDDFDDFNGIAHRHEIIGNICENPKLVKYEW